MTGRPAYNRIANRLSWPVFLLFVLSLCALVASLAMFVHANNITQRVGHRLQGHQSQELLVERLLTTAKLRGDDNDVVDLVNQFEELQLATGFSEIQEAWSPFRAQLPDSDTAEVYADRDASGAPDFSSLIELSRALGSWLIDTGAPESQVESAGHLFQLANSVRSKFVAKDGEATQPLRARGPWLVFEQILNRFEIMTSNGTIADDSAQGLITELRAEFTDLDRVFNGTLEELNANAEQAAFAELERTHAILSTTLANTVSTTQLTLQKQNIWFRVALLLALISVALLCFLALELVREASRRNSEAETRNDRSQASILRLLDEISALADGDLNTRATVTEDHTGVIADSVNYAVGELKRLVAAITNSADRVTVAVEETGSSAQQLAKASSVQSREIQRSTTYLKAMADTMGQMSQRSTEASQIASQSVDQAVLGRKAVKQTADGMGRVETQLQQTATLIKRLGESSQKIGEIVDVINTAASRTRLIALNSVIQSNSAEDQQHMFSTIADEIQTLSSSLKDSGSEIAVLVGIIQDDASAAKVSMEQTTSEVVCSSKLADQAGSALKDIEFISRRLSVVVEHLANKTIRQSEVVNQLSVNMGVINDVTRRSAHGMKLSAGALEDLRRMATELRDGVADFVLPPVNERWAQENDIVGRPLLKKRESAPSLSQTSLGESRSDLTTADE